MLISSARVLIARAAARLAAATMLLAMLSGSALVGQASADAWRYLSPFPGARFVSPGNNVVFREGRELDPASVARSLVSVVGTTSGSHEGHLTLARDGRTLVFVPTVPFALGETVDVSLPAGVRGMDGSTLPPVSFSFEVALVNPSEQPPVPTEPAGEGGGDPIADDPPSNPDADCTALPTGFPLFDIRASSNPDPGYLFLSPTSVGAGSVAIIDNVGQPLFYRRFSSTIFNFEVQPNGLLTYFESRPPTRMPKFFALDSTFTLVDSFTTGNGYVPDTHELLLLPDGHFIVMAYDPQPVAMDQIVPGGDPDATVIGVVVQELDADRNVVFQWRTWDHFQITDAVNVNLKASTVDFCHSNAIELTPDGNLLLCSRNMSEITKIDRRTGEVLWRMGSHAVNNEFTFVNDTRGFMYQHDPRWLPNGHMTLFDNGNSLSPQYSRMVEYEVDEVSKVATKVMEYSHTPAIFSPTQGSARRLPSGKSLIGWGGAFSLAKLTELNPDGSVSLELGAAAGTQSYRALRSPWRGGVLLVDATLDLGNAILGRTVVRQLPVRNGASVAITIACAVSSDPQFAVISPLPLTLAPGGEATLDVAFTPSAEGVRSGKLYLRVPGVTQFVAQDVVVEGVGCTPTSVSFALSPTTLNLRSMGHWVTAILEPEPPASPADIDIASVLLNGSVPVDASAPTSIGDADLDGRPDLTVKLDRAAFELTVVEGDTVPVTVTGEIGSGCFEATDMIRVIRGHVSAPTAGSVLQGGTSEVRWDTPAGVHLQSVAVLFSSDDGATWNLVANGLPNTGSYLWTVPGAGTDQARIAVVLVESADLSGYEVDGVLAVSDRFVISSVLGVGGADLGFALHGAVPNPSRGLNVSFSLATAEPATLAVFDVGGRQVGVRQVGLLGAGRHLVSMGAPGALAPGVYLVHLVQGSKEHITRAVVIR